MRKSILLGIILLLSLRLVLADITIFPNYYDVKLYPGENNKTSVYIENSYDEYYEVTINLSISNKTIANCTFLDYSIAKTYNISGLTAIQDYVNISALSNEAVDNAYCRITYNWTFVDVSAPVSSGGGGGGGGGGSSTPSGVNLNSVAFAILEGKEGDKIYFDLDNINHYVFFQEIKRDWAKLIISSPYRYIVELDEGKFDLLDMDDDGTKEFKISLIKSDGTWADVKLEKYEEVLVQEPIKKEETKQEIIPPEIEEDLPIREELNRGDIVKLLILFGIIALILIVAWIIKRKKQRNTNDK